MHVHRLVRSTPLVLALAACPPGPHMTSVSESDSSVTTASTSTTETSVTQGPGSIGTSMGTVEPTTSGTCVAPDERCDGADHQTCVNGTWVDDPCPAGTECLGVVGACQTCTCTAEPTCVDTMTLETCGCFDTISTTCLDGQVCDADAATCSTKACEPGAPSCSGQHASQVCNEWGSALGPETACAGDELCDPELGTCQPACAVVAKRQSSLGCEFWAVDMANVPPRDAFVYAIAVSNPSVTETVNVEVFDGNKNGAEQKLLGGVVAPRQVKIFMLSGTSENGQQTGFYPGDAGFLGTGIAPGRAFRVVSDLPIVATQFNPLGGAAAYTTDASLLLPTHALGLKYYHLAWDQGLGVGSSLVVVATAEQTKISIRSTVNLPAGQNGLPALSKGIPTEITLGRYDYVQLSTNMGDLTGSEIVADKPVALFGGHSCGNVPTKDVVSCDHLEEQIFPVDTWGAEYVALRAPRRGNEDMHWRVLARENGATVTFTPKPEGLAQAVNTIPAGGFLQFNASGDFHILSNHPILVAGYMYGYGATGDPTNPGDPSMVQMVPVAQWLNDYVFLVDSSYTNDNVRLVRKAMNPNFELGCLGLVPEDHWQPIAGTGYVTASVNINPGEGDCQPGTNTASAAVTTFGIVVIGEAGGASYAYPGGMALKEIAPG